jgi:alanine racemase
MSRPIFASIVPQALRDNYAIAKRMAPYSRVLAVVKADAYGHGLARVAAALPEADGFATLEIDGATWLRESRPDVPVLLLEGFFSPRDLHHAAAIGLASAIHSPEQLRMLELEAPPRPLDLWLKINTGMNRLGFRPEAVGEALERLRQSGRARSITLMSHFATADGPQGIAEAMQEFQRATRGLTLPRSVANSAALLAHPGSHLDAVRMGIALYGASPFVDRAATSFALRPAMTLASQLIAIQDLKPGDSVGYGAAFEAERAMRIGVVACGYGDGYPRHAPTGTPILVGGARTRTVGRVSMDLITVDLSPVPAAVVGTPVVLWGEGIPVDEVALAAGTVGYELLCAVTRRVPMMVHA